MDERGEQGLGISCHRGREGWGLLALLACCAALAGVPPGRAAEGEGPSAPQVLRGAEWALYDLRDLSGLPFCGPYRNNGFRQELAGGEPGSLRLRVRVDLDDLDSRAPFPFPPSAVPPEVRPFLGRGADEELRRVAAERTAGCRTAGEAVTALLCWVSSAVGYETGPTTPSDPRIILRQGRADCVGMAELAVALLNTAGIPARGVRGFLFRQPAGEGPRSGPAALSLAEGGLHRWLEVYYPDRGWVFSDPFRSINFVDARYVVLAVEDRPPPGRPPPGWEALAGPRFLFHPDSAAAPECTFVQRLERGGTLYAADILPSCTAGPGVAVRRNRAIQFRPAFVGRVEWEGREGGAPERVTLLPGGRDEGEGLSARPGGSAEPAAEDPAGRGAAGALPAAAGPRTVRIEELLFSFTDLDEGAYRLVFYRREEEVGRASVQVRYPRGGGDSRPLRVVPR